MRNKYIKIILNISLLVIMLIIPTSSVKAEVLNGYCGTDKDGKNVAWNFEDGVLSFSGSGSFDTDRMMADDDDMYFFFHSDTPLLSDSVEKIVINEGITSITSKVSNGANVFASCTNLQEVILPNTLTAIGDGAFRECENLKEITIPNNITKIGNWAFLQCKNLEKVSFECNDYNIEYRSFAECEKLSAIDLSGAKKIGVDAFDSCVELENVIMPDDITEVTGFCFCTSLKSIKLPGSITKFGDNAFFGCINLQDIMIPDTVTEIGNRAFSGCYKVEIVLPPNLQSIGTEAFLDCGSVKEIILPETVETLGIDAFSVERLVLSKKIKELSDNSFLGGTIVYCTNKEQVEYCKEHNNKYIDATSDINIEEADIEINQELFVYTGKEIIPDLKVYYTSNDEKIELKEGFDYEVSLFDNVNPGTATLKIDGKGVWKGTINEEFEIYIPMSSCDIELSYYRVLYDGMEKQPIVSIRNNEKLLLQNVDYQVVYSDNTEEGSGKVIITGRGIYKGEVHKIFEIYKYDLNDADIQLPYSEVAYDGNEKKPDMIIKYGEDILVKDIDYTVTYSNNIEKGQAMVVVRGKGVYKGEIKRTFEIYKFDLTKANIELPYSRVVYDGNEKIPEIIVKYEGVILNKDIDYEVTYYNNTEIGIAKVQVNGVNQYFGMVEKEFEIDGISLENAKVSLKKSIFSYDGSPKTPSIDVKLEGEELVKDKDYFLTYENNIDDGTAYVVVTGTGMYKGVIKVSFIILPYNTGMDAVYSEETLVENDFVYGITDEDKNEVMLLCQINQEIQNVKIPATVIDDDGTTYTVTSIGNKAFYRNTKITSVSLPEGIISICDDAFYGCSSLTNIIIPNSVGKIKSGVFNKCSKLSSIIIPSNVTDININVFDYCDQIKIYGAKDSYVEKYAKQVGIDFFEHVHDDYVIKDLGIDASCTEKGLTEGSHCSVCGEVIKPQETVEALGHKIVTDEAIAPTCTKSGLTEGSHCSVCGEVIKPQETVEALGHKIVTDEAIAPTCTKSGLTEGSHCSVCGEIIKPQETVGTLGHKIVTDEAIAPTCTETGLTEGSHCSVCGEMIKPQETVEAIGHKAVTDEAVAPTCTETGLTEGSHCSVCGEIIKPQETVGAIRHNYNSGNVTKVATEKETGIKTFTCSVCGESYSEIIPQIKVIVNENNDVNNKNQSLYKDNEITNVDDVAENNEQGVVLDETLIEAKDVGETIVTSDGSFEVTVTGDEPEAAFSGIQDEAKVVIPEAIVVEGVTYEITSISVGAFKNNKKLKNITIGKNVEEIEKSAFSGCKSLSKITIKSKQIESIGDNAFANCTSLTSITIPTGVEMIGKNAFSGCTKLKKVIIRSTTITKIGRYAFKGIKKNAKIKCPKKQYNKYRKLLKASKVAKTVKINK